MEQITALKFLGLPLVQIRRVLEQGPLRLADELARQEAALLEKRRLLDQALQVIRSARHAIGNGEAPAGVLRRIMDAMAMQNGSDWLVQYYSPEARAKLAERATTFTLEMQKQIREAWRDYYRDAAALQGQNDPHGSKAAALAERHRELVAAFTGDDPEIEAGLKALYRDRENWPSKFKEQIANYENGQCGDV